MNAENNDDIAQNNFYMQIMGRLYVAYPSNG